MVQSHFDLEVHSASRRHDLLFESERQRRLALLETLSDPGTARRRTGLTGLRSRIATFFARLRPAPVATPSPEITLAAPQAAPISVLPMRPRKPAPTADTYAGFIVVARASSVPISAEPDRIHDLAS